MDGERIHHIEFYSKDRPKCEWSVVHDAQGKSVRDGEYRAWHPLGALSEQGFFAKGLKSGKWTTWWPNGLLHWEGEYIENRKEGIWVNWSKDHSEVAVDYMERDDFVLGAAVSVAGTPLKVICTCKDGDIYGFVVDLNRNGHASKCEILRRCKGL